MMQGWKRVLLVPVDPCFAKDGAGAQFDIAVTGPASSPKFGLDRRKKPAAGKPAAVPGRAKPPVR
jgi:hypothetical protein